MAAMCTVRAPHMHERSFPFIVVPLLRLCLASVTIC